LKESKLGFSRFFCFWVGIYASIASSLLEVLITYCCSNTIFSIFRKEHVMARSRCYFSPLAKGTPQYPSIWTHTKDTKPDPSNYLDQENLVEVSYKKFRFQLPGFFHYRSFLFFVDYKLLFVAGSFMACGAGMFSFILQAPRGKQCPRLGVFVQFFRE
jgi:hypothetical protein